MDVIRSGKLACRTWTGQAGRRPGGRLISFTVTEFELSHVSEPVGAGRLFEIPQSVWNVHGVALAISMYKHLSCAAFKIKLTTGSGNVGKCENLQDRSRIWLRQKAGVCASTLTLLGAHATDSVAVDVSDAVGNRLVMLAQCFLSYLLSYSFPHN